MDPRPQSPSDQPEDQIGSPLPEDTQTPNQPEGAPAEQSEATELVSASVPTPSPEDTMPAEQPEPGQTVGPAPTPSPAITPEQTATPNASMSSAGDTQTVEETPDLPPQPPVLNKRIFTPPPEELLKKPSHKKRNILIAVFSLLILSGVGAYFGYYVPNKPENMWRTALDNTGKGYDKLIEYSEEAKQTSGWSQEGKFNIDGMFEADANFKSVSSGNTSNLTGSVSAMGAKVNFDVRTLPSSTATPDMYFKVDGLDGLGTLIGQGDPKVEAALNNLNNQWYVIDHTLFEQMGAGADKSQSITFEDVVALFKAFGVTSKEYVFTDDPEKATIVIKNKVGKETKDGRSVYHYKVDTNNKQVEKYAVELCKDLKSSKIGETIKKSAGEDVIDCNNTTEKAKQEDVQLKPDDVAQSPSTERKTFEVDAWVDTKTKLFHSIRFADSKDKNNSVEISQAYAGGDTMPFKLKIRDSSEGNVSEVDITLAVNTKTKAIHTKAEFSTVDPSNDENNMRGDFELSLTPSKVQPEVSRPDGAKNIIELLNALGIGDLLSGGSAGLFSGQARVGDTAKKNDLRLLQTRLETYYIENDAYPTLAQLNNENWIEAKVEGAASETAYGYAPKGASGDACNNGSVLCESYELTALLSTGEAYTLKNMNE